MFVGAFCFRNFVEKLCGLWALSFNKRVRVWACKIRKPHTHVFVPTSHKAFLRNYWNTKELAANIWHKPISSPPLIFATENCALTFGIFLV